MLEFYMIFARKNNKIPEFYMIITLKSPLTFGGGARAPVYGQKATGKNVTGKMPPEKNSLAISWTLNNLTGHHINYLFSGFISGPCHLSHF